MTSVPTSIGTNQWAVNTAGGRGKSDPLFVSFVNQILTIYH